MQGVPITRDGYEKMTEELNYLKREALPEVIEAIATAREFGDLSENAEYHAAKDKQGFIRAKITDLQVKIGQAQVIEPPVPDGKVVFGCRVTILDLDTDKEYTYRMVGPFESNAEVGDISIASPLGKALVGKEEGDEVSFQTPDGPRTMEIVEVN